MQTKPTRVLISAAGTAAAYHLAETIKTCFPQYFEVMLCDINPKHLVAASIYGDHFERVVPVNDPDFRRCMLAVMASYRPDVYIPLIDHDVSCFPADDPDLLSLGIASTAPTKDTMVILRSKVLTCRHLESKGISVPRIMSFDDISSEPSGQMVCVKPDGGWGSMGVHLMTVTELTDKPAWFNPQTMLIQEYCRPPEITVEVFNDGFWVRSLCRERIETKAGVCTKARIWHDRTLHEMACSLVKALHMPVAFCFQVMSKSSGDWTVTDVNPRIGAGTSLSSACGWSLVKAALAVWAKLPATPLEFLDDFGGERFAVRVFKDIRTI